MVLYYGVGIMKVTKFFKLQKKVIRIISGVSNHMSCRQIFKVYNILTLFSLYIVEVICFVKKYKNFMAKNLDIHSHNMAKKTKSIYITLQYSFFFKKSVINMGISLNNKVPNQITLKEIFN
jgi:hypothetical protein